MEETRGRISAPIQASGSNIRRCIIPYRDIGMLVTMIVDTNRVTLLFRDGSKEELPLMSKREAAERILDRVEDCLKEKGE